MIILGNLNSHSSEWKQHCGEIKNTVCLEILIEEHDLILKNEPGVATTPIQNSKTLIIDLTFTTSNIGVLDAWVIDEELSGPSNHEVVICDQVNLDRIVGGMGTSQEVTG